MNLHEHDRLTARPAEDKCRRLPGEETAGQTASNLSELAESLAELPAEGANHHREGWPS